MRGVGANTGGTNGRGFDLLLPMDNWVEEWGGGNIKVEWVMGRIIKKKVDGEEEKQGR